MNPDIQLVLNTAKNISNSEHNFNFRVMLLTTLGGIVPHLHDEVITIDNAEYTIRQYLIGSEGRIPHACFMLALKEYPDTPIHEVEKVFYEVNSTTPPAEELEYNILKLHYMDYTYTNTLEGDTRTIQYNTLFNTYLIGAVVVFLHSYLFNEAAQGTNPHAGELLKTLTQCMFVTKTEVTKEE